MIVPADEATSRGWSAVSVLLIDEAARVSDAVYHTVRPMLAVSRGRIVLLSTPNGARGFFWQTFTGTDPDWLRVEVSAEHCPRISPAWLARERERIGRYWYEQEYQCRFVDAEGSLYRSADIAAAVDDSLPPLFGAA